MSRPDEKPPTLLVSLDVAAMGRILVRHEQILPVDADPPHAGYGGGVSCGCDEPLGELDPTIYERLAAHQAEVLARHHREVMQWNGPK